MRKHSQGIRKAADKPVRLYASPMPSYAAFLGHQPHISTAELAALLPDIRFTHRSNMLAIFETALELDQQFLNTLGGTFVLAERLTEGTVTLQDIPKILSNELQGGKRTKVTFSLRSVGLSARQVKTLYRSCKQHLKDQSQPSRYVGNEHRPALPIVLHENEMIGGKRGCEIVIVADPENGELAWVGRTVGAQDIEAYSKRDMRKPVRDTTVGLLPPKLAQILLNLGLWAVRQTGKIKEKPSKKFALPVLTVLDPFCGTGVIPMECLLRGWPVLASDSALKAVNGCGKNLEWLRKEEKIAKKDVPSDVCKHDARKPFPFKQRPDAIVTETTLGPALADRPTLKDVSRMRTENESVQDGFLRNAITSLPGTPIVCTFPVWYTSKGPDRLQKVWKTVESIGLRSVLPPEIPAADPARPSLLYRRPGQMVGREIVVLLPK